MMMKTDKSVHMMGFASHNPRVETRGYSDLIFDLIQINPQIHRCDTDRVLIQINPQIHLWDIETLSPQIPLSVSTDYLPRVETRGYSEFIIGTTQINPQIHRCDTDRVLIQINPQIHLWDIETPNPQIPLSVSTDYQYLKTDKSVRMGFVSYHPRVETRGYSDETLFHFREWLFRSRNELFSSGNQSFISGRESFRLGKQSFHSGMQSFSSGKGSFCSGKRLFCSFMQSFSSFMLPFNPIIQSVTSLAQPFTTWERENHLTMEQSK